MRLFITSATGSEESRLRPRIAFSCGSSTSITWERIAPAGDADFLARGQNSPEKYIEIFKEVCEIDVDDDGLTFDAATVTAERNNEDADYGGMRVKFIGDLENARIPIQIDVGFGDVITPAPLEAHPPTRWNSLHPSFYGRGRSLIVSMRFRAGWPKG